MNAVLLALTASVAAAPSGSGAAEPFEVALPDDASKVLARAVGLGFVESQDGEWYGVDGDRDAAERAGLRTRAPERSLRFADGDDYLPTPEQVEARLGALVDAGAASWIDVGRSREDRPILGVRIGNGDTHLRVLGGHHGNEGSSTELALALAEALARDGAPEGASVWIVPQVNPDGMQAADRYNAAGVDLNRNYGYAWSDSEYASGDGPFSEPETRAVRALVRAHDALGALTLHSGETNIGWTWNYTTTERAPDEPLLSGIADDYAALCGAQDFWTTNGADWYVTFGDTTDWTYGGFGQHDFTVEATYDKSPPIAAVDAYVSWHLEALRDFLSRPADLRARVVDANTGLPLPARLAGPGGTWARTGLDGRLARWAEADGTEGWTAWAEGYASAPLSEETRLAPLSLLEALPEPRLLSRGDGPVRVRLDGAEGGSLLLTQPGEQDVYVAPAEGGGWIVDANTLAPGAWTLVTDAGAAPRALLVGEVDDRVRVEDVGREDGALVLYGVGFGRGTEAWALYGAARAPVPLAVLSEAPEALRVSLPEASEADVLVWTHGATLAVVDVNGDAAVDDRAPPAEPAAPIDDALRVAGMCGTTGPGAKPTWIVLLLGAVALRRRRSNAPLRHEAST